MAEIPRGCTVEELTWMGLTSVFCGTCAYSVVTEGLHPSVPELLGHAVVYVHTATMRVTSTMCLIHCTCNDHHHVFKGCDSLTFS